MEVFICTVTVGFSAQTTQFGLGSSKRDGIIRLPWAILARKLISLQHLSCPLAMLTACKTISPAVTALTVAIAKNKIYKNL